MKTKTAIIASGIILLVVLVIFGGSLGIILSSNSPQHQIKERVGMVGSGLGTLTAIGMGIIWTVWLAFKRRAKPENDPPQGQPRRSSGKPSSRRGSDESDHSSPR